MSNSTGVDVRLKLLIALLILPCLLGLGCLENSQSPETNPTLTAISPEISLRSSATPTPTAITSVVTPTITPTSTPVLIGDGYHEVNWDIKPGTWSASGGAECQWSIEHDWGYRTGTELLVDIQPTDIIFQTRNCGEWSSTPRPFIDNDALKAGVVQVLTEYGRGSGFIYDIVGESALILTNQHVIDDNPAQVLVLDTKQYEATTLGSDEAKDIALLLICCSTDFTTLAIIDTSTQVGLTRIGISVAALGYPYGEYESTIGAVVDIPYLSDRDLIPHSAPLNPGNSGGPLISMTEGRVLGVNTYALGEAGYAAPIYSIEKLINKWRINADI